MTCTIIGLVVACSGAPLNTTPAQSLALMKPQAAAVVDVQIPERPATATGPDSPERALAIMKQHEQKILLVAIPDSGFAVSPDVSTIQQPPRRFGESPWWWKLYDPWWYEPWVAQPWQLEPTSDVLPVQQGPRRFGESPWWWKLYDPWWYEPWVAKPWQLEPRPEAPPRSW